MAALLRHLQDPDFDIDDYEGADLMDCWQHLDGGASPLSLVVNNHWRIRTGYVPASAFSPEAIPVEALRSGDQRHPAGRGAFGLHGHGA